MDRNGIDLSKAAYVDDTAKIFGKVSLADGSSVWPYAVIRAEMHDVVVGERSNIQDFVMIHVGNHTGTKVGAYTSITHHCTLHGCTIGDNCLIGINSTIMDGCVIGDNCIIAGHTFLKEGTVIPDNSIVMGSPGKVVKERNSSVANKLNAMAYYENALAYTTGNYRRWSEAGFLEEMQKFGGGLTSD